MSHGLAIHSNAFHRERPDYHKVPVLYAPTGKDVKMVSPRNHSYSLLIASFIANDWQRCELIAT